MVQITEFHQTDLRSGQITKMRWSPDGRLLAIPTQSGSIIIFDINAMQPVQTIGRHSDYVTAVAWDLKGSCILTGSLDRSIALWEVKSGTRAEFTIEGHTTPVHSIEWTDEEAFAITCSLDRLRVLDGACLLGGWTKEMEAAINKHGGITAASCSRQSTFLLGMAEDKGARLSLVSLLSGMVLSGVRMERIVRSLTWSPVEDVLAVGTDQGIWLFRCNQEGFESSPRQMPATRGYTHAIAFSGDGSLLASRDEQGVKIWDVKVGKLIASLDDRETFYTTHPSSGVAFHPSLPLLATAASEKSFLRILDLSAVI